MMEDRGLRKAIEILKSLNGQILTLNAACKEYGKYTRQHLHDIVKRAENELQNMGIIAIIPWGERVRIVVLDKEGLFRFFDERLSKKSIL